MIYDMGKFSNYELSVLNLRRAATFLRKHITDTIPENTPLDELEDYELAIISTYDRMLMMLEGLQPTQNEWVKPKEGHAEVIDLATERAKRGKVISAPGA